MSSVIESVPDREALLVEYPGFVNNPDAAIQTLGGLEAISATAEGTSPVLSLHLRPGDPLSHPLLGYKQKTRGLLLRISRKAGAATEAEEDLQAEVVAHVKSLVQFPGMADFQYVSCDTRPLQEQAPQPEGPPGLEAEPMLFPPPLFTKQDLPMDYAFRSFYSGDPDYMKAGASLGRGTGRLAAHVINFQAVNVLPPMPDAGAEKGGLYKDQKAVLKEFSVLLAQRPVWTSAALKERVSGFTDPEFEWMLPRIAYMFRNGPWRGLWVRRGFDPRSDSSSRMYQALEYRVEERSASNTADASAAPSVKDVSAFAALPTGDCILQLCDLSDEHIQALVQKPAQLPSCSIKTGWFSAEVWHELRQRVDGRFAALQHGATSSRVQAGAGPSVPSPAPDAASASTRQEADFGGSNAGARGHAERNKVPQQQEPSNAALAAPALQPHVEMTNSATAAQSAQGAGASAEQLPPGDTVVSMADDVSAAHDVSAAGDVGEGAIQRTGHDILPAVYLQSVLDSWQAEAQSPAAPRTEQLLAALGEDNGDFEIYEASEAEHDVETAGPAADDLGSDEGGQTHDEAEESDESHDEEQAFTDQDGEAGAADTEDEAEEDEEEYDEEDDEAEQSDDQDMADAYNEDDDDI
ncbi:General transcription factor 3C polypeptide 5 at N-terminal half [Coccomyxa sp. Obi]|nr:General transcription factor 3C polypeptide 5 at N-terminal half [Coccomyxa sp. Obi]